LQKREKYIKKIIFKNEYFVIKQHLQSIK